MRESLIRGNLTNEKFCQ